MNYLSVCSGIEAATVAWHPLGWRPFAFAEIEKFPSAVLAHHYPHVPNLGDMTKFKDWPDAAIDVLVGGTPCQSFSVAGLRKGLDDPRGNLMLTYVAIARDYRPAWVVWENVPGVLSDDDGRSFATLLGLLTGRHVEVPAGGWQSAGVVPGLPRAYGVAWRVLDAQYVRVDGFARAVPQRRRRVFVVGHLGDWRRAAAVLFELEGLSGNPAPRRQAGERIAPTISARPSGGGGLGTDFDCDGGLITAPVASTLNAHYGDKWGLEDQHVNQGCPLYVAHALRADGFDASEDGTGRGTPLVPIAFSAKDYGGDAEVNLAPTLRAGGFTESHANAGVMPAIAYGVTIHGTDKTARAASYTDVAGALRARTPGSQENSSTTAVQHGWAVRRLTPRECERLQGFPDDYTLVPYRGKPAADGPRYKALGNSMAVNCMRWLGRRIARISALTSGNQISEVK
jgi:DNA (cytosine-5)-methyltransferase 1